MADTLQSDILKLINNDDDTVVNIKNILTPISSCIDNPTLAQNINEIVTIMTTDRDKNGKIDVNDLKLMVSDPFVIVHLVMLLFLILTALPSLKITINIEESEIIILKLLMYIFLVIIPKTVGVNWTMDEKTSILTMSLSIFQTMQSLEIVKVAITKFANFVKTNKYCSCLTVKSNLIEEQLPEAKINFIKSICSAKEKGIMQAKIENLEKKLLEKI